MIEFTVYGNPVPQGRPRFARRGKFVTAYDPGKSRGWKEIVKAQAVISRVNKVLEGPLSMHLHFYLPRPKSLPKKIIHHIRRPDTDNLCKAVKDALEGICYRNDSQVVEEYIKKEYSDNPCVRIKIEVIE